MYWTYIIYGFGVAAFVDSSFWCFRMVMLLLKTVFRSPSVPLLLLLLCVPQAWATGTNPAPPTIDSITTVVNIGALLNSIQSYSATIAIATISISGALMLAFFAFRVLTAPMRDKKHV